MSKRGLGREQVHQAVQGRGEHYPHPLVSCMMPLVMILAVTVLGLTGFSLWKRTLPIDVIIPDVVGLPAAEAKAELQRAGLVAVEGDNAASERMAKGSVISVNPDVGRSVKQGRIVRYIVSSGSLYTKVPQIINVPNTAAREMLERADLQVAKEQYIFDDEIPVDRIIAVSPKPGLRVLRDSTVSVLISKGPELVEDTEMPDLDIRSNVLTIDLPADVKEPAEVRIDVTDDEGKRTVYRETHNPGDNIVYTVQGIGTTTAEVYFGTRLLLTRKF